MCVVASSSFYHEAELIVLEQMDLFLNLKFSTAIVDCNQNSDFKEQGGPLTCSSKMHKNSESVLPKEN